MKTELTKDQEKYLADLRACASLFLDRAVFGAGVILDAHDAFGAILDVRDAFGDLDINKERGAVAEHLRASLAIAREALGPSAGWQAALGVLKIVGEPADLTAAQQADVAADLRVAHEVCQRALGERAAQDCDVVFRIFVDLFVDEDEDDEDDDEDDED